MARLLLLGSTGVEKELAVQQLNKYRKDELGLSELTFVDFESDFVTPNVFGNRLQSFLDATPHEQWHIWQTAWEQFASSVVFQSNDLVLGLHGVLARQRYGLRSVVSVDSLRDFCASHIVTLIDDVYMQWSRTQQRAGNHWYRGQPTIAQLVEARRAELLIGDLVSRHSVGKGELPLTNWLVAARHPAYVLHRIVGVKRQAKLEPVYLSFPISEPRKMGATGDSSGIDAVNNFLQQATSLDARTQTATMFCPLSIDELPLLAQFPEQFDPSVDQQMVTFNVAERRWHTEEYYGANKLLLTDAPLPDQLDIPVDQVQEAAGLIVGDVGRRDFRLVEQARSLAVFCPVFNGHESGGVKREISYALALRKPVHIYQDPQHDPAQAAEARYGPGSSALGAEFSDEPIVFHDSLAAALQAATES